MACNALQQFIKLFIYLQDSMLHEFNYFFQYLWIKYIEVYEIYWYKVYIYLYIYFLQPFIYLEN